MKRNLLLLVVFAILASCSNKGENNNANGSSNPLKKVAEAVLLCERMLNCTQASLSL